MCPKRLRNIPGLIKFNHGHSSQQLQQLEPMHTWLEISKKAIERNLKEFRNLIGKDRLLMPVIKANAYGHGFLGIAQICDKNRAVDRICVVNDDEALELIKHSIKKHIMILSFYELEAKKLLILAKKGVIFPLFTLEQAKILNKVGEIAEKAVKVHIKIDTGATRVGILSADIKKFIKDIGILKYLNIEGVWSHFASSEDDEIYTKKQSADFWEVVEILKKEGIDPPLKHMSCSAASINFTLKNFNAIRLGLSLYGLYPDDKSRKKIKLNPALAWKTKIIQVKEIPTGAKIGYGGTFVTKMPTKIAIIPVGYWDGYDRKFSNNSWVLIKGKYCPARGRICMNLTMIDVTHIPEIKAGEIVTLIGEDGKSAISADDLAKWAGTINYEIVDRINPLLPRVMI